jgi:hypothetical protein
MTVLYTALGRFESRSDERGRRHPVVIANGREHTVGIHEFVVWTCLAWRIAEMSQIKESYRKKLREIPITGRGDFSEHLNRLIARGLAASGEGRNGYEALYSLLGGLCAVPVAAGAFTKVASFAGLILSGKFSFAAARRIFRTDVFSHCEKQVIDFAEKMRLSTAEIMACIEKDDCGTAGERKSASDLCAAKYPDCGGIVKKAEPFACQKAALAAAVNLYLRKHIIFEKT